MASCLLVYVSGREKGCPLLPTLPGVTAWLLVLLYHVKKRLWLRYRELNGQQR